MIRKHTNEISFISIRKEREIVWFVMIARKCRSGEIWKEVTTLLVLDYYRVRIFFFKEIVTVSDLFVTFLWKGDKNNFLYLDPKISNPSILRQLIDVTIQNFMSVCTRVGLTLKWKQLVLIKVVYFCIKIGINLVWKKNSLFFVTF